MPSQAYQRIRSLGESSLSRIFGWIKGCAPFGIIIAFRKEPSEEENFANATQLGKTINAAGYGFIELDGGYVEDPETNPTPVVEFSFFVPGVMQGNVDSDNHLKELLLEEGKRYNEETIIYRDYGSRAIQMLECKTGSVVMSFI